MFAKFAKDKKLLWGFITLLWLSFTFFAVINYYLHRNLLIDTAINSLESQTQVTGYTFDEWMSARQSVVISLADELSKNTLSDHTKIPQSYFNRIAGTELLDFLSYTLENNYYRSNPWVIPPGYSPNTRPWYTETKAALRPITTNPYISVEDNKTAFIAFTVPIIEEGTFMGVAAGEVEFTTIYNKILGAQLNHQGKFHLVNSQGKVVLEANSPLHKISDSTVVDMSALIQKANSKNESHVMTENKIYAFYPLKHNTWWLVSEVDKSIVLQPVYLQLRNILLLFIFLALSTYILQRLYSSRIFKPIIKQFQTDWQTTLPNKNSFLEGIQILSNNGSHCGVCLLIEYLDMSALMSNYSNEEIREIHREIIRRVQSIYGKKLIQGSIAYDQIAFFKPMNQVPNISKIDKCFEQLQASLTNNFLVNDNLITIKFRFSSASIPNDGSSFDILNKAQIALSTIQDKGNNFKSYTEHTQSKLANESKLVQALNTAIKNNEFSLVYQPIFSFPDKEIEGVEVLSRWNCEALNKTIPPLEFVQIAEQNNLIHDFSLWLAKTLFKQISIWQVNNISFKKYALNLSSHNLHNPRFIKRFIELIKKYKIDANQLEIEITEHVAIEHFPKRQNPLKQLRDLGVSISVDDFGTGYSSLSYLKQLPINTIKIDRSFIKSLPNSQHDVALSKAIIDISKEFGLHLIAEGVENSEQADFLHQCGCSHMQGYLFAKPMTAQDLEVFAAIKKPS